MERSTAMCPICGSSNASDAYFCAACGKFIFDAVYSAVPVNEPLHRSEPVSAPTPQHGKLEIRADGTYRRCPVCGEIVDVSHGERYLRCPVCRIEGIRDAAPIAGSALLCAAHTAERASSTPDDTHDVNTNAANEPEKPTVNAHTEKAGKLTLRETLGGAILEIPENGAVLDAESMICRTYIPERLDALGDGGIELYTLGAFWYVRKRGGITLKSNGFAAEDERVDDGDRLLIGGTLELTARIV